MDELGILAGFAADLRLESVPGRVLDQAKRVLLDTVGAALGGSGEPELRVLQAELATGGPATVIGSAARANVPVAALLNAMAACWYELDEGNRFAKGHPGIHVVPVVLAMGEERDCSGAAALEALIAGYEVASRVGRAGQLRPELHPHGTWGALGAAVAAAKLSGADAATLARAIEIAASIPIAPPTAAGLEGATVRNANAGVACQHGLLAVALARAGVTAPREATARCFGAILGVGWDASALTDALGERYELETSYFKPYPACRHTHGALDLLVALRAREPFEAAAVEAIEVATYGQAAVFTTPVAETPLAARFSTPTLLALSLLGRDLRRIDGETLRDETVRSLAGRIRLTVDPALDARYPQLRPTRLTVRLRDGRTMTAEADAALGDPECPLSDDDLDAKFLELASPLGEERARVALAALRRVEAGRLREATEWLAP
ncbi:MAG: 2-methylcitrate dehydratase [Dehalococcoidia bacterium]|nr:MAG: 2-methylcitrate dehydratase [Dehalococcoidia bacterium]